MAIRSAMCTPRFGIRVSWRATVRDVAILVSNLALKDDTPPAVLAARHLGVPREAVLSATVVKRSLDARQRRKRWRGVLRVELTHEEAVLERGLPGVRAWTTRDDGRYGLDAQQPVARRFDARIRPIVVGAGPAGLFAALYLAEAGARVTLLERGDPVEERVETVNRFWRRRAPLDPESNLVFGEGGAGTFSDGKIYTRRRDGELGYIFAKLVEFGAEREVLQESWAHLGTDKIRDLLIPFRNRLRDLGTTLQFRARVVSLWVDGGRCVGVRLADGTELEGGPVLVATGHSARDAIEMLVHAGAAARPRDVAIGVRVEHPQAIVDRGRYGAEPRGALPPASYRMAHHPSSGPAARTFCMCPGGMVVPAMNHPERVVVNGMSFAARRAYWANSAIITDVPVQEFGNTDPLAGFRWQDAIERRAFAMGGADYAAPAQRVEDFLAGRGSREVPRTSYPLGVVPTDLRELLPDRVAQALQHAVRAFDAKVPGFAGPDGVLIAPESRTTSPVRFERDEHGQSTTVADLFPIGEGAGSRWRHHLVGPGWAPRRPPHRGCLWITLGRSLGRLRARRASTQFAPAESCVRALLHRLWRNSVRECRSRVPGRKRAGDEIRTHDSHVGNVGLYH